MTATSTVLAPAEPRRASRPGPRRRAGRLGRDLAVVGLPGLLALVLCAVGITARSIGFDEAASVTIASQHGSALWRAIAHDGGNMSGYYLLLHVVIGTFGHGLLAVRAPSAIAAAVSVGLTAALARRLFDHRVALIAGTLAAVSLPLVFWGQSARGYAPMVALVAGSFLAFVALAEGAHSRSPAAWMAYFVCTTLAIYAGFVAVLVVPAQLLALVLWRRRAALPVISALALSATCCAPLVVLAATRGPGQLFWVPRPTPAAERQVLEAVTSAGLQPSFPAGASTIALVCLTVGVLLPYGLVCLRRRPGRWHGLLFAWLVVPLALAWLESLVGQPVFLPRNLLIVLPAVAVLLALAVTDLASAATDRASATDRAPAADRASAPAEVGRRSAGWLLLGALLALRALPLADAYGVSPENWRAAAAHVLTRAAAGDCIAFYPSDTRMAFAYYVGSPAGAPRSILPAAAWDRPRPYVEDYATIAPALLQRLPAACPRLWLVSSHAGQPDGPAGSRANLARLRALRAALGSEYPRAATSRFGSAAVITVELFSASGP